MNEVFLRYGRLSLCVEAEEPITISLPLEHELFPMWIPPMQITVKLVPLASCCIQHRNAKDIPNALCEFYSVLETLKIKCLPPYLHCNSWWQDGETVWGHFPYETDNFILEVSPKNALVTVYGNEFNLNRVILDMLACFSELPPLHGAAMTKNGRTVILLSNSGGGKTRILKHLLDKEYAYIADEEIFWSGDQIFCCGRVIVEKEGRENLCVCNHAKTDTLYDVTDVFLMTGREEKASSPVLFPVIARQSFWAQILVEPEMIPEMTERFSLAIKKYSQLLKCAKIIKTDYDHIENVICTIEEGINNR